MFRCQVTGKMSKPLEKLQKITVQTRPMEYRQWDYEAEEAWFTQGFEIVKEINASEEGLKLWNSWTPEQQAEWAKNLS